MKLKELNLKLSLIANHGQDDCLITLVPSRKHTFVPTLIKTDKRNKNDIQLSLFN